MNTSRSVALFLCSTISIAGVAVHANADFTPTDWRYTKEITVPVGITEDTLVGVELDAEVFAHARYDLSDLRVVSMDGVEVPYVLRSEVAREGMVTYQPSLHDLSYVPGSHTSFVLDMERNVVHNEIVLETPAKNFRRQVTVSGSNDREAWHVLAEGRDIYDYSMEFTARHVRVSYPDSLYRYVMVRIDDADEEPLIVRGASVQRVETVRAKKMGYTVDLDQTRDGTRTIVVADLMQRGLETDTATFEIEDRNFQRHILIEASDDGSTWRYLGSDVVYAYHTSKITSAKMVVQYAPTRTRYLRFSIENHDDAPLVLKDSALLEGLAHSVLFLADPNVQYGVYYGYAAGVRPQYDLGSVLAHFDEDEVVRGELGPQGASSWYAVPVPPTTPPPVVPWTERYAELLIAIAYASVGGILVFLMMHVYRNTNTGTKEEC